jgi:PleD family two-component response regulator
MEKIAQLPKSKKILVVDDDDSILDAITLILEEEGYNVETTFKGEETYTKVSSFQPDLILLDVLMSGNDGRAICKNLKTEDSSKDIPIIMISAHPNAEKSIQACGANAFIAKPFQSTQLLQEVERQLRTK